MIYIVIAVHNRRELTLGCLTCLAQQTLTDQRVIVVDDGSTDGTSEHISAQFPDVVVLPGTGSLWWAGATNLGIRYVLDTFSPGADDFILTLNDDTKIQPDYLASLLTAYRVNAPCLVGSVSVDVNAPQRLLYAGTHLNLRFPNIENWADTRFNNSYALLTKTGSYFVSESLPGRGMLIPLPVFNAIGLFDESHFQHHMADLDFSVSARKAGFQLVISAASVVHEYTDATGINVMRPMSLNQFWQALSATKSPINWKTRYHFALKQAPYTYLYFGLDMLRIIGGYALRQIRGHLYALCNSSSFAKKMSP